MSIAKVEYVEITNWEIVSIILKTVDRCKKYKVNLQKFRSHLDSLGLKWSGIGHTIKPQIRLFNKKGPTMFGQLVVSDVSNIQIENLPKTYDEIIGIYFTYNGVRYMTREEWTDQYAVELSDYIDIEGTFMTKFESVLKHPPVQRHPDMHGLKIQFEKMLNIAYKEFTEIMKGIDKNKESFGKSINDTLVSMGATEKEISTYWNNIKDKRLFSANMFMSVIKYMKTDSIKSRVIDVYQNSGSIGDIRVKHGFDFLPNDYNVARAILVSFIESNLS